MNKRLVWAAAALAALCFASCKDKAEKAFQKEQRHVERIISRETPFILGTWVKDEAGAGSMPDILVIEKNGKLAAYEDNDGGQLGLDPKKEKRLTWKTEGDAFIIDYGWETVRYYYLMEGRSLTFNDEITKKPVGVYTRKEEP